MTGRRFTRPHTQREVWEMRKVLTPNLTDGEALRFTGRRISWVWRHRSYGILFGRGER